MPVRSSRHGFTLTEVMVAVTVLVLVMAIIFTILSTTTRLSDFSTRGGDSSIEAGQVLDRIGTDIEGMLIRPDADQYYNNSAGNSQMFFYSQSAGFFNGSVAISQQSPISLVGYQFSSTANPSLTPVLQRIAQGLNWSGANALPFLVFPTQTSAGLLPSATSGTIPSEWPSVVGNASTSPFWHTIGSQTFRLSICFQLSDGTYTLTAPSPSQPKESSSTTNTPSIAVPGSLSDTVGLVIAIAVLDNKSRTVVPSSKWANLIAALPDPTATNLTHNPVQLMDSIWNGKLNQSNFAQSVGVPVIAASQIRVFQRYFPLHPPQFQ